eukprot:1464807-Prymnesium_polylepis.1
MDTGAHGHGHGPFGRTGGAQMGTLGKRGRRVPAERAQARRGAPNARIAATRILPKVSSTDTERGGSSPNQMIDCSDRVPTP